MHAIRLDKLPTNCHLTQIFLSEMAYWKPVLTEAEAKVKLASRKLKIAEYRHSVRALLSAKPFDGDSAVVQNKFPLSRLADVIDGEELDGVPYASSISP